MELLKPLLCESHPLRDFPESCLKKVFELVLVFFVEFGGGRPAKLGMNLSNPLSFQSAGQRVLVTADRLPRSVASGIVSP